MSKENLEMLVVAQEVLQRPGVPVVGLPWDRAMERIKGQTLTISARHEIQKIMDQRGVEAHWRAQTEELLQRLDRQRREDKEELGRFLRDLTRVKRIISHLEKNKARLETHIRHANPELFTLEDKERHRRRMEEWDDEIAFRKAMMERLRENMRDEFSCLYEMERDLKSRVEMRGIFIKEAREALHRFRFDRAQEEELIEEVLNPGEFAWMSKEHWEEMESHFPTSLQRDLRLHYATDGEEGYRLRSGQCYYSSIDDRWVMGDEKSGGLSFRNMHLSQAIAQRMMPRKEVERHQRLAFLIDRIEDILEDGVMWPDAARVWFSLADILDFEEREAREILKDCLSAMHRRSIRRHLIRLFEVARADGVVLKSEAVLLNSVDSQLKDGGIEMVAIKACLKEDKPLLVGLHREEVFSHVCQMALCDEDLNPAEVQWIKKIAQELGLTAEQIQDIHRERRVV